MSVRSDIIAFVLATFLISVTIALAGVEDVHVTDEQWQLELVAQQPEIVTPIGIAFDRQGRLLVIESHSHKRPADYEGPAADRIRRLEDRDGDGRLETWSTFHEGLRLAMNLVVHGDDVFVVTTEALVRLRDTSGDGYADDQKEIISLECSEYKSHSGLVGLCIVDDETMYLGLGKNTGKPYRVVGSDGAVIAGDGDGGSIFRCRIDGSRLQRIATGLWNPWGMCVDPFGRLFCTENDPDSSPPCQLLHLVPGGDYGFQARFGRDGRHPLQSPNGQLPGTLGMVCAIGESPCDIIPYRGALWIASWVDHAIRRYSLVPRGASFEASRETIVQGNTDFRPVGLASSPDGSLYFSDWVDRSYPIHGQGRIWRLSRRDNAPSTSTFPAPNEAEKLANRLRLQPERSALRSHDPYLRQAAIYGFAQGDKLSSLPWQDVGDARERLGLLEAARWRGDVPTAKTVRAALSDSDPDVRMFTTRWVAELQLGEYREDIERMLDDPDIDTQQYLVSLSAADWLERGALPSGGHITEEVLAEELLSGNRPPAVQSILLRLLPPDHACLTPDLLGNLIKSDDAELALEAVRTLALQSRADRFTELAEIAGNNMGDEAMRLEAISGLGTAAKTHSPLLQALAGSDDAAIQKEATRALRRGNMEPAPEENKPAATDIDAWLALLEREGDPEAGKRLFFNPVGPLCSRCHRFEGRGGNLAPDLTRTGQQQSRRRIVTSILQPSDEVNNQYATRILLIDDGQVFHGLPANSPGDDGIEKYYDSEGNLFSVSSDTIEERIPSSKSMMPDGLDQLLTVDDLRDLLALLMSSRTHSTRASHVGREQAAQ